MPIYVFITVFTNIKEIILKGKKLLCKNHTVVVLSWEENDVFMVLLVTTLK